MLSFCLALSTHIGIGDGWRENHPCIQYERGPYTVGAFMNSEDALSVFASRTWEHDGWFVEGGAVTGYSGGSVLPMIRAGYDFGDVRVFAVPGYRTDTEQTGIVLGVEFTAARWGE